MTLRDFNNYLESVEEMTFNLVNGVDVEATEGRLRAYERENQLGIKRNKALDDGDKVKVEAGLKAQKERSRLAREMSRQEEVEEKKAKEDGRREILERLAHSKEDPDKIMKEGQKVMLKKSSARGEKLRRENMQQLQQAQMDGDLSESFMDGFDSRFKIAGLKPVAEPEPEKPFDPFGGVNFTQQYYTPLDHYEHPFSQKAKTDTYYTAGGYSVVEYQARAMFEAFSGLGVFIGDEKT